MEFTCFHTLFEDLGFVVPVTAGYDAPARKVAFLKRYEGKQFIHSGNWWNIRPEKRTRELVLEKQLLMLNPNTFGFMSVNIQPGNDPLYWVQGRRVSGDNYEAVGRHGAGTRAGGQEAGHFQELPGNKDQGGRYLETCLDNATWARDRLEREGVAVPIFCALQPTDADSAETWFSRALDEGHVHLCMGVSEFLRYPKYRDLGIRTILEITRVVGKLVPGKRKGGHEVFFHLSGFMSLQLLPVVAFLGATSTDGSTPVQSALAYGTVFTPDGKGVRASQLDQKFKEEDWPCNCPVCNDAREKGSIFDAFRDKGARVRHNVHVWQAKVEEINRSIIGNPAGWYSRHEHSLSAHSRKYWLHGLELLDD